jgi:putative ABC transport system ATP-binding protein
MTTTPALQAIDLYRFFHAGDDETLALRGVSLSVDAGEVVAITGPSGSGKSTLMTCLAGLDEPDGGLVRVLGQRLSRRSEAERARRRARHIGVLYQQANLAAHLSVAANVAVAQQLVGRRTAAARTWADAVLDRCGIARRAHALPTQLSGGELARAGLAVALANRPAVLLADEPTGELDATTAEAIMDLLHDQAGDGTAILIVTHDPAVAGQADRELHIVDGTVAP